MPHDMTCPYFVDLRVDNGVRANTLEEVMKLCTGFSGIHKWQFRDKLSLTNADIASYALRNAAVTGTIDNLTVTTNTADPGWVLINREVIFPIVCEFDFLSNNGGFVLGYGYINPITHVQSTTGWVFRWYVGDGNFVEIGQIDDGVYTAKERALWPSQYDRHVRVVAVAQRLSDFEFVDWLSIAVYFGDHLVISTSIQVSETINDIEYWTDIGKQIGFIDFGGGCNVGNLQLQELNRIVEWASIDPGEAAGQGMTRALRTSRVFFFCRYDGTLKIWRPRDDTVTDVLSLDADRVTRLGEAITHLDPNHIRVQGAFLEGDVFDDTAMNRAGRHIFTKKDDPNLWSDDDIEQEGYWTLLDTREGASSITLQIPAQVFLEPMDFIRYDSEFLFTVTLDSSDISELDSLGIPTVVHNAFTSYGSLLTYLAYTEIIRESYRWHIVDNEVYYSIYRDGRTYATTLYRVQGIQLAVRSVNGTPTLFQSIECKEYYAE
jgi:hypothetical protein